MSARRVDQAKSYAADLTAQGVRTYVEPSRAAANLPCVLILPPALTFSTLGYATAAVAEWRLAVLSEGPPGLESWEQLDTLLEQLAAVATVTTATPASYTLTPERDPLPAYLCSAPD